MKALGITFLAFVLISCGPRQENKDAGDSGIPVVSTVNYPLYYFAQRIGSDLIRLEFPAPPQVDPAYWVPDDEALSVYQGSDLILANGANYAKWMHNVSLPSSRIFNTSSLVADRYIQVAQGPSHSHGPEGEHVHTGYAFTTWLDLQMAVAQAGAVKLALRSSLPDKRDILEKNYQALERELLELHTGLQKLSGQMEGVQLIGSHPVYHYLSRAYGLPIRSVHFEPGLMPSEEQWKEFEKILAGGPSRLMLWEEDPLPEVEEILLEKGIQPVVFHPCGNRPAEGDFITVMRDNIHRLKAAAGR